MAPEAPAAPLPCAGLVLAGGASRRMGRDKALLDWGGRPVLAHQMATLRAAGLDPVLVSGDRPAHGGIPDAVPARGPLAGIAAAAQVLPRGVDLLVVPVDMPRLEVGFIRLLARARPGARCLHPAGHVLPLRLRLDAAARAELARRLAAAAPRERSLRALQAAFASVALPLPPGAAAQLVDGDDPAAWARLRA